MVLRSVIDLFSQNEKLMQRKWRETTHVIVEDVKKNNLRIGDDDLKNLCLIEIEMLLQENGRSLNDFKSMPSQTQ
ncbi:hypothetical protein MTR_0356s0040 [Medicago truncatula]|uniref:Uncharacterized protein n=1 Tax=Medicago truncatula TaxID=3880 RepID=Q1RU94_MEDTR|nr:hypothetical protein MtrDRAFT_AC153123g24v2 [Medicago truncatula]KEH16053.1 hypothetical protein MTR_0356s0040 [Medicago truncatula]